MLIACSFCKQPLIQAHLHIYYEYAACLNCSQKLVLSQNINDFQRISLFQKKGNQKITKTQKINNQLRQFLSLRKITPSHPEILQAIDQFFARFSSFDKSRFSDTSTSPSQGFQQQQLQKPKKSLQNLFETKVEENKNIQKLIEIKDKIALTGNNLIQKIRQNQKIQKQVQNINQFKQRLLQKKQRMIETGNVMKNKFLKLKSEVKDIKSELPSIKDTLKGVTKFGFFKKW